MNFNERFHAHSTIHYTIQIARPGRSAKKIELLLRDFVVSKTHLPIADVSEILAVRRTPTNATQARLILVRQRHIFLSFIQSQLFKQLLR